MTRFALIPLVVALFAIPAARAQTVSIYGTANPAYLNHLYTITSTIPPQYTLAGSWFVGANAGVTINLPPSGPVSVGIDFRGGPEIGTPGLGSALAGIKLGFKQPLFHLKPYIQLSTGFLEQRHQTGSAVYAYTDNESYFGAELFGGVDYPIARHIDLRMLEVGLGTTHVVITNGINTTAHPEFLSLSSGIVFNF